MADDLRGQVLLKMDRKTEARQSFEAALKKDDQFAQSILNLAGLDMMEGKKDQAQQRLEAQVKRDPTNPELYIALATLAQVRGAATEVILAELEKATRADPRHVKSRLLLIERHFSAGSVNRALEAARNAVAAIPDNAQLYEVLARCLASAGDARQALAAYVKLTAIAPRDPAGYLGQAKLLLSMNDGAGAVKTLQQLLAFAPKDLEARRLVVSAALLQKQPEKALASSRELQRDVSNHPLGFALEGEVHLAEKRWDQAATAFRAAMAKPGGEPFVARLSQALTGAGKVDEAQRAVAESLSKQPQHVQMLKQLAAMAYSAGDRVKAQAYYEQALAVAPEDVAMLNNLAWILVEAKDPKALAIAERAAARAPNVPEVLETLAQALALKSDYVNAVAALRRAVQVSPAPAPLRLRLARMLLAANNPAAAKTELETLRDLGAAFPDQAAVRQLLAQIRQ
jgi:putative PEP-CTERM system TPR-repeat lipoprotein